MRNTDTSCRSCGKTNLTIFLDLGHLPIADRLLTDDYLKQPEPRFPLEVAFCPDCSLVQILETVPPEILFGDDYQYYSSFIPALLTHSKDNVTHLIEKRNLDHNSLIVELASNDGYLLKNYVEKGVPVLGIDPAEGPAKTAEKNGVPTMNAFFTKELALQLREEGRSADVIHANNVLAHVADTNGFVEGIKILLHDDGVAVIEAPYVKDLIDHCEFDTIYHQHLCYFSVTSVDKLFRQHSLFLNEVKWFPIHGGSLRYYFGHNENVGPSVQSFLLKEHAEKLDQLEYYANFAEKVEKVKASLINLLASLKAQGKSIAAYGAAAKGTTLINYVDIDKATISFVADRNTHKHGLYMTGKHWPIYPAEKIVEKMPDYVLVLAWNFADEIMSQQEEYRQKGGKFIIPIPEPKIVENDINKH